MFAFFLIAFILELLAGMLLILSYTFVLKSKKSAGIAITGCVLGIIGSILLGLMLTGSPWVRNFMTPFLNWLLLIIYVVALVLTLVWRKIR